MTNDNVTNGPENQNPYLQPSPDPTAAQTQAPPTPPPVPDESPKRRSSGGIAAIIIVAVLAVFAGMGFVVAYFVNKSFEQAERSDVFDRPSSSAAPYAPSPLSSDSPAAPNSDPGSGFGAPTIDELLVTVTPQVASLVIPESCQTATFVDGRTEELDCGLNMDTPDGFLNFVGVAKSPRLGSIVDLYEYEQWRSIESAPGHDVRLGTQEPLSGVGNIIIVADVVADDTVVTYGIVGEEEQVSKILVDFGIAQYKSGT